MSFAIETFETNSQNDSLSFAFDQSIGEGQSCFFVAKFPDGTLQADIIADSIFGAIVDSFSQNELSDSYDRFEDALKAANLVAKKYSQQIPSKPDIVIAFFDFFHLYLSQSGNAESYLIRSGSVSQISESDQHSEDFFVNILSGQVSVNDLVMLSSKRVLQFVSSTRMTEILEADDFVAGVKELDGVLATATDQNIVATVIGVGKRKKKSIGGGFFSQVVSSAAAKVAHAPVTNAKEERVDAVPSAPEVDVHTSSEPDMPMATTVADEVIPKKRPNLALLFQRGGALHKIKNTKGVGALAMGVLGVFLLMLIVNTIRGYESEEVQAFRQNLEIANENVRQAESEILKGNNAQANDFLSSARESVDPILRSNNQEYRVEATNVLESIENLRQDVENIEESKPQLIADLGLKIDNVDVSGLLSLNGSTYVYDLKKIYKTVRDIVEPGIRISEGESILAATTRSDQNTLTFLTDSPRIVEYREGVLTPMPTEDDSWKKGVDIKTYGRFAYILDPLQNQIWKYERKRSTYSGATAYIRTTESDLSRAVAVSIDGSVYVLSDDGTIKKFFSGDEVDYSFKDMPSLPLSGKNLRLYTNKGLDNLFILDPNNSRILVFEKGESFARYKKQVIFDLEGAQDFFISDSELQATIMTSDKIYEVSL